MPHIDFPILKEKTREPELIKKILAGEKELYGILVRQNNLKLYRVIRSYLKNEQEVEDAMQNTYVKAYEKLFQFSGNAEFSTWLIRIGINTALKALKDKEKQAFINEGDELIENDANHSEAELDPEKSTIRNEIKEELEKAIDSLSLKYRSIYVLHEIEKLSVSDIAAITGLTEVNVRVRLHRAKSLLRSELEKHTITDIYEFGNERCDAMIKGVIEIIQQIHL